MVLYGESQKGFAIFYGFVWRKLYFWLAAKAAPLMQITAE